jgi:hypothetical protein
MALFVQAPVLAILVLLIFGRQAAAAATAASWRSVVQSVASTTFALALGAVWLGGCLAAWDGMARRSPVCREGSLGARLLASPGARIVALGVLCLAQSAVLLAIVHWGTGLRGPWLTMFGMLVLVSAVSLSFGLVVSCLVRTPRVAVMVLLLGFVAMFALGGWIRPLPALSPALRPAAIMPSRWAFERLLVLESDRRSPPGQPGGSAPSRDPDLAEASFPAGSERMGPISDAMALGCMLAGLAAAGASVGWSAKASP